MVTTNPSALVVAVAECASNIALAPRTVIVGKPDANALNSLPGRPAPLIDSLLSASSIIGTRPSACPCGCRALLYWLLKPRYIIHTLFFRRHLGGPCSAAVRMYWM
jgi:hypothetical protein